MPSHRSLVALHCCDVIIQLELIFLTPPLLPLSTQASNHIAASAAACQAHYTGELRLIYSLYTTSHFYFCSLDRCLFFNQGNQAHFHVLLSFSFSVILPPLKQGKLLKYVQNTIIIHNITRNTLESSLNMTFCKNCILRQLADEPFCFGNC